MLEGFNLIAGAYSIGIDTIIVIMIFAVSLCFIAKGIEIFAFVSMILNAIACAGFYVWSSTLDWSLPLKAIILCVILLAITLNKRVQNSKVGIE